MANRTRSDVPLARAARAIQSFVENPVTDLLKGVSLLLIGFSEAWHTLQEDITSGHLRVGHGLVLIGIFSILDSVPKFIEGLLASQRYLTYRKTGRLRAQGPDAGDDARRSRPAG